MQCYTDLIPPTAVTCATALPFLNPASQNLVVAKTSLLQVFDIVTTTDKDKNDAVPKQRLVLVGEYTLSGTVTGLARVKALETKNGGEALLVAGSRMNITTVAPRLRKIDLWQTRYDVQFSADSLVFMS